MNANSELLIVWNSTEVNINYNVTAALQQPKFNIKSIKNCILLCERRNLRGIMEILVNEKCLRKSRWLANLLQKKVENTKLKLLHENNKNNYNDDDDDNNKMSLMKLLSNCAQTANTHTYTT